MDNNSSWLERAVAFVEGLRHLPGEVKVEVSIAPTLSEDEVDDIARRCRLPIPRSLRRFWMEASGHCHLRYWWDTPPVFEKQRSVAFKDWGLSHCWGGPDFESPKSIIRLVENDGGEPFREDFPKDARLWAHSLPLIPVGNGDYAGLYVKDDRDDPPVVFLCHEGYGGSDIIAPTFGDFLVLWEQLGYIGIHFLSSFIDRRSRMIDPAAFPTETEALRSLLRNKLRLDLERAPLAMTEDQWRTSRDPDSLLRFLESRGSLDEQKVRRYACACCRRVWDRFGDSGRRAVEVAERFADGLATSAEMSEVRLGLLGGSRGADIERTMAVTSTFLETFPDVPDATMAGFMHGLHEACDFAKREGIMHSAAYCAVDATDWVSWQITQHLDEPELSAESAAHAELIRQIFGNPFHET